MRAGKYALSCPECEYHKNRAAHWRAEAYKWAGHDVIERPKEDAMAKREWVGLTDEERNKIRFDHLDYDERASAIEAKLKEKNT